MEVIRFIVFIIGVALVSGQCNESNIDRCWNQMNGAFANNNGIMDISTICSESTKTSFACVKNEMNKCSSSLSFTRKEELSLVNRTTVEGLQKICNVFTNIGQVGYDCFRRAVQNAMPSIQACMQSDSAFANANGNSATLLCRTFEVTYKCGLERLRKDCPTHVDDFRSWRDAVLILFACEGSGNNSNRYNSAPTFLLIAFGVQVLVAVGL